jgi:endo-1,4-beta-D-glucanase Y
MKALTRRAFSQQSLLLLASAFLPRCVSPKKIGAPHAPRTNPQEHFWNSYKNTFLRTLPNGMISAVPYYPIKGQTPSEAMGHALIFAAQRKDWVIFNALLKGLSYFKKANGVFRWKINNDGTIPPGNKNLNSASETEQNVAYALLLAHEKTGKTSYRDEALKLLASMWKEEVIDFQGRLILMPSDRTNNPYWPLKVDGQGNQKLVWNPAYHSPKMFRKFAKYDKAHDWNKVIKDWYALANKVLDVSTANPSRFGIAGINPMPQWVWLTRQGKSELQVKPFFPSRDTLGSKYSDEGDTIRIPIYVGMDASHSQGKAFLQRFYALMRLNGPQDVTIRLQKQPPKNKMMAIAAYATGLKAIGSNVAQFVQRIKIDKQGFTGDARGQYYDQTICYYAYLLLNDKFSF